MGIANNEPYRVVCFPLISGYVRSVYRSRYFLAPFEGIRNLYFAILLFIYVSRATSFITLALGGLVNACGRPRGS